MAQGDEPSGRWLRERRLLAGLTQSQLAERAGVSVRAVRNAESGAVRQPRSTRKLIAVLGADGPVRIGVLGPLTVCSGDVPVALTATKLRLLLGLLALRPNDVVPRDEIVDVLWADDRPPASYGELLHTYVARLRRALEPARVVQRVRGGYLLSVDADQLDLLGFDAAVAARDYPAALGLWRGPVLGDVDRLASHPLARGAAARYASAVLAYADLAVAQGNPADAITHLRTLITDDPLHEAAHARLVVALAADGQQAPALAAFGTIRQRLADELGIEPGHELRAAHARALRPDMPATPAQLPADNTGFIGRAVELAALDDLLPAGDARIAVVSGTAGVGKTAVALRWAHRSSDRFPDGRLYVDLRGFGPGTPVEPDAALSGFLRALGCAGPDIPSDVDERSARYRTVLDGRRMLVVLDNAASVAQVRPLLPGTASCAVVVTSRDALPGLVARHGARRVSLALLTHAEALGLLRTLLGDRVGAEPDATRALVGYCVRLPLALRLVAELAISRPRTSLATLATELADERRRLDLLDSGGDPHTALRAVFSWSYAHLPPDAARVFRLWGSHPGHDLTHEVTAALADVDIDRARRLTTTLERAHLIAETTPGRYQLHDLLRVYAAELAAEQPEPEAPQRLFEYYLATAKRAVAVVLPWGGRVVTWPGPGTAAAWLAAERANLLAVADRASGEYVRALSAVLWRYFDAHGHHEDALTLHARAAELARAAGDRIGEVEPLTRSGLMCWRMGWQTRALRYVEDALAAARDGAGPGNQSYILHLVGMIHLGLGRFAEAEVHLRDGLAEARAAADPRSEALMLAGLGLLGRFTGRLRAADEYLTSAVPIARRTKDGSVSGYAGATHGFVLSALGRHDEAIQALAAGIEDFRTCGHRAGTAQALSLLGDALIRMGRHDDAEEPLLAAIQTARETHSPIVRVTALRGLGDVRTAQHRFDDAAELLDEALRVIRECEDLGTEPGVLNSLGALATARGNPADAIRHHTEALTIATETDAWPEQARALDGLAEACGDTDTARRYRARARELWRQMTE